METPPAIMSSPSKALNPLSPERINQQTMPHSPSLPSDSRMPSKTLRGSEVQSRVAFLNTLARGDSPAANTPHSPSAGGTAALQRAILGREEAESTLANVCAQLSEAQSRERRLTQRLDSLMEEFHSSKERQANERSIFEKEIRKARKEAFRAGSTVVKMQEELKHSKAEAKGLKEEIQAERAAKEHARQEAFERAYTLAGLTEELEVLKGQLRSLEANTRSDNLEAQAQKMNRESIGTLLGEGDLAMFLTPTPRRPKRAAEDSVNSPLPASAEPSPAQGTPTKKQRLSECTVRPEDQDAIEIGSRRDIMNEFQRVLEQERQLRSDAEDMIRFMQLECEFKRCSCRLSECEETSHAHEIETTPNVRKHELVEKLQTGGGQTVPESNEAVHSSPHTDRPTEPEDAEPTIKKETDEQAPVEPMITFSPETGTFRAFPSPLRDTPKKRQDPAVFQPLGPQLHDANEFFHPSPTARISAVASEHAIESDSPGQIFSPTPRPLPAMNDPTMPQVSIEQDTEDEIDSIQQSMTKTIPLKTEEERTSNQFAAVPGTPISREEALAQIRARRGRTGSMKRSVSASESTAFRSGGMGVTPVRTARRIPNLDAPNAKTETEMKIRRDMSAPVKFRR